MHVTFNYKMVKNRDCDRSPEVFRSRSWGVCPVSLVTTYLGDWWCSSNLTTHFRYGFKPLPVVRVNILSDFLEGWCQCFHLRNCLDYVFSFLLKAASETQEVVETLIKITWALIKSMVVIASGRVWASVKDSGDHLWGPSVVMLSKQATLEECRRLTWSRASIHSIHLVRQRPLSFVTFDSGCALCIASSNFFCRLGWAKIKKSRQTINYTNHITHTHFHKWSHNCQVQRVGSTMGVQDKKVQRRLAITV